MDVWSPERKSSIFGEWMQIMFRVLEQDAETVLKASGKDGVFTRPFFATEEDRLVHKVVWLPTDTKLQEANRQAERMEKALGLVANSRGLGIRVPAVEAEAATSVLLGPEAAADLKKEQWEISNVPFTWSKEMLEAELAGMAWQAQVQCSRAPFGRTARTWFCLAEHPPMKNYLQHEDGLAAIQKAKSTPPKQPVQTLRPKRTGTQPQMVARVAKQPAIWPKTWRDVVDNGRACAPASSDAMQTGSADVQAVPQTQSPAHSARSLEEMIATAVAAAMRPVVQQVSGLQQQIATASGDPYSLTGAESQEHDCSQPHGKGGGKGFSPY